MWGDQISGSSVAVSNAVRRAEPGDEPVLRRLQTELRNPNPELLTFGLSVGWVLVSTTDRLRGETQAAKVVGYMLVVPGTRDGESLYSETHVAELVVEPAHRREGRARALLGRVLRPDHQPVTLLVAPGNTAAVSLYRSLGFRSETRLDGVYDQGAAILMSFHSDSDSDSSGDPGPGRTAPPE